MYNTREEWLVAATESLRPLFNDSGSEDFGAPRVSLGFSAGGSARKTAGTCWSKDASADGTNEIFISPLLENTTGANGILAVLVHELCHASGHMDHKKGFRRLALAVGLTGKMTSTIAGPQLCARIETIADSLGTYPGAPLTMQDRKKQTTRMIKMQCDSCGFVARASRSAISQAGFPTCGCGGAMA